MGWLARTLGYEKPTPKLKIDQAKSDTIRQQEAEIAMAMARVNRANRSAYNDLAKGVLAEVMKGRQ